MLAIINVIAPIFALMALGYLAVRYRLFPADGIKSLIAFVNNFATPCLLFYSILTSDLRSAFNLAIIGPFYIAALICFVLGIFVAAPWIARVLAVVLFVILAIVVVVNKA